MPYEKHYTIKILRFLKLLLKVINRKKKIHNHLPQFLNKVHRESLQAKVMKKS